MADRSTSEARLEIAHVLFIDIVGYSKLLTNEQRERQQELNRIVRETEQFREAEAAGKLIRVPTGDGMVLAFFTSPMRPFGARSPSAARSMAPPVCQPFSSVAMNTRRAKSIRSKNPFLPFQPFHSLRDAIAIV